MATNKQRPQITFDDVTWGRLNSLLPQTAHLDVNSVLRDCISRGLSALEGEVYGSENKRLVRQKLQQRQGSMQNALDALRQQLLDINMTSDQMDALGAALNDLEKGLAD